MELVSTPAASNAVVAPKLGQIGNQDGSSVEFLQPLFIVEGVDTFPEGDGDLAKAGFEDIEDALSKALLATFLSAFLSAEAFEVGDVGHAVGVLELVEVLSEGDHKLVGQGP